MTAPVTGSVRVGGIGIDALSGGLLWQLGYRQMEITSTRLPLSAYLHGGLWGDGMEWGTGSGR